MAITSTWTTPSSLDRNVGDILTEAIWDNLVSDSLYLWDTLHNYARAAAILSLTIGAADVNLYRSAADVLKTDDQFWSAGNMAANQGGAGQLAFSSTAGVPTIYFGSAADTNLYRSAANVLATDDTFTAPNVASRLAESVLGSAAASITFSSIPSTYRHLRLVLSVRGDTAATQIVVYMRINSDATSNYQYQSMEGNGASFGGGRVTTQTEATVMTAPAATALASLFAAGDIVLPAYKATDKYKSWVSSHAGTNTTSGVMASVYTGYWASTVAVTAITLFPSAGNFATGTTVTLYGEP
jgi:hypothetical protein